MGLFSALGAIGNAANAGVSSFVQTGQAMNQFRQAKQDREDKAAVSDAFAKAKADRQADIDSGQTDVGDLDSYYQKEAIPTIKNHFMETGDVQKANMWEKWNDQEKTKANVKKYTSLITAYRNGDTDTVLKGIKDLYNDNDYIQDGYKAKNVTIDKDKDGNQTGYTVEYEDSEGKTRKQSYTGDDMIEQALTQLDPMKAFQSHLERRDAADKVQGELMKISAQHDSKKVLQDRKFKQDIAEIDRRAEDQIRVKNATGKNSANSMQAKFAAFSQVMGGLGFSKEDIKKYAPVILGGEAKHKSAADQIQSYINVMNSKTLGNEDWNALSDDEKLKKAAEQVRKMNEIAYDGESDTGGNDGKGTGAGINTGGTGVMVSDGNGNTFTIEH